MASLIQGLTPPHRKLRNRLSQQAFRRRQAERIKELQSRVDTAGSPDSERIEVLQRENRRLRSQLVDVQAKMSRLLATVQKLNDSVAETLGVGGATGGGEKVIGKDTEQDFFGKPLSGVTETQRSQQPTAPSWPSLGSPGFQSSDISFPAFSGPGCRYHMTALYIFVCMGVHKL